MRPIINRQQAILTTALASFAAIRPPPAFAAQSIKERLDAQNSKLLLSYVSMDGRSPRAMSALASFSPI